MTNKKEYYQINKEHLKKYQNTYNKTHKKQKKKYDETRIRFKNKQVRLNHNPRAGICIKCKRSVSKGEIKRTNLHHEKYDKSSPESYTIELCVSCHMKREVELRKQKKELLTC